MAESTVICKDVHGTEYMVPVSQLLWRPAAYGIVIKDSALLLSKQFESYDLPGGGIDLGELPEAGVIREVKEETGIDVTSPKLFTYKNSFYTWPDPVNPEHYQSIMFYFTCEFVGGEFSIEGFDEDEKNYADMPEWVPLENLKDIKPASTVDWREIVWQLTDQ